MHLHEMHSHEVHFMRVVMHVRVCFQEILARTRSALYEHAWHEMHFV